MTDHQELADFFDNAPVCLHWCGADGIILRVNQAELDLLGYSIEECVGHHIAEFHADAPIIEDILARLSRGETLHQYEARLRCKDGSIKQVMIDSNGLWQDGRFVHTRCFTRDITARKQTEAALRNSEERYRVMFGAVPVAVFVCDRSGVVQSYNRRAAELWGRKPKCGHPRERYCGSARLYLPDGSLLPHADSPMVEVLRTGVSVQNVEMQIERPDGSRIPVIVNFAALKDEQGTITGAITSFDDIAPLRRAQAAVRQQGALVEILLNAAPLGVYLVNADLRILQVNPIAYAAFGDIPDLIGRNLDESLLVKFPANVVNQIVANFRHTLETGAHFVLPEVRLERLEPCVTEYYHWQIHRIPLPEGGYGVVCYFRDISAQVLARAAIAESEERFRAIADNIPQLAWMADPDGSFSWFNRRWLDYTGTTLEQNLGDGWKAVHHPDHIDRVAEKLERHLREGRRWEDTFPLRGHDGSYRWFLSRMQAIRDESGNLVRFFGTNTDVTKQRAVETALKESDERKDEFLAMLAHELRNPLAPILSAVEVLQSQQVEPEMMQSLTMMMQRQITQMVRLVDDLLDVSRVSRGKIELRRQRIALADVVNQAVEAVRPLCKSFEHELNVTLPSQPIWLNADAARLAQAIGNLLNNACKFTDRGGRISLNVEADGEQVVIRVKDSGVGIAADQLPRVFELFTQLDASLERQQSGLGIGLTLVKNLVEMHGGTIEAFSGGVAQGSEFVLRLPMLVGNVEPLAPVVSAPVSAKARRILVVDDHYGSANAMARLLQVNGHETHTAYDGLEALEAAARLRPDVVLLDLGLPKLNGYAVAQQIRAQPWGKEMILVALTGWGQDEDRRKTAEAGFNSHLVKPVARALLTTLLAEMP